MTLKFETTAIPAETGRPKAPNPYIPAAQAAIDARAKGEAVKFSPDPDHRIEYVERKLREAGKEKGVSIRIKRQDAEGKVLVIWARDLITRSRGKASDTPDSEPETQPESEAAKPAPAKAAGKRA